MKIIECEICACSAESCLNAVRAGATRVELCTGAVEGGTTPSAAAIRMAREITAAKVTDVAGDEAVSQEAPVEKERFGLELAVMIRPRGGDFIYSDLEFEIMKRDIEFCKEVGADCVVLGLLLPYGRVDTLRTAELVKLAAPMEVAFHRAFDVANDWRTALEDVIAAGCGRVLTSGCSAKAIDAIDRLSQIVEAAAGRIEIMAGSGIGPSNAREIAATGVDALHFSATAVRQSPMKFRRPEVPMSAAGLPEFEIAYSDEATIRKIVKLLRRDFEV